MKLLYMNKPIFLKVKWGIFFQRKIFNLLILLCFIIEALKSKTNDKNIIFDTAPIDINKFLN
jgi:hypothetical protein